MGIEEYVDLDLDEFQRRSNERLLTMVERARPAIERDLGGTFAVADPLNRRLLVTGKGLAGYITTAQGERLAFAIYVNNVSVSTAPDEVKRVVGQALGEIAAAAYDGR